MQSSIASLCSGKVKLSLDARLDRYARPNPDDSALRAEFYYTNLDEKQCLETVRDNLTAYDRSVLQMDRRAFQIAYDRMVKDVGLTANERIFLAEVDHISTLRLVTERNALLKAVIAALGEIGATSSDGGQCV